MPDGAWLDPYRFGALFGALAGGVGGTLLGLLGALLGALAPRGKGRLPITIFAAFFAVFGLASLVVGLIALVDAQPYGIWYPMVLVGAILTPLSAYLLFGMIPRVYRQAEQRRLAAEELRHSAGT